MLPGKHLTVTDVLAMVRRRLWLIALPPLVTLFAALLYSSRVPNLYKSEILIAVDPQGVPQDFVRSTVTLPAEVRLDAITVQVLSRTDLEELVETFNLYPNERQTMPMADVVQRMRSNVEVALERPRDMGWGGPPAPTAFRVSFVYPLPKVAAQVAQELGARFVRRNSEDRGKVAGATNKFLEAQLAEAREKLEKQEQRLEAFRQQHGRELPSQLQTNMQALANAQLRIQGLVESIARDRDRKQMLERLYRGAANEIAPATSTATAGGQVTTSAGGYEQQLADAEANLHRLEQRYGAEHPDVIRARRTVAELRPQAEAQVKAAARVEPTDQLPQRLPNGADAVRRENLRQMQAEIESLDRQTAFKEAEERRIREEAADYQRRIEAVPGLESDWVSLTRDYETQQNAYRDLLSKSSAAQVAADMEQQEISERFRIVDPAVVPLRPLPSKRARYNALGLFAGLGLGLGIAALLELRDASFRTSADVLEQLALPVLANVPYVATADEKSKRRTRLRVLSACGVVCLAVVGYITWTLRLWQSLM